MRPCRRRRALHTLHAHSDVPSRSGACILLGVLNELKVLQHVPDCSGRSPRVPWVGVRREKSPAAAGTRTPARRREQYGRNRYAERITVEAAGGRKRWCAESLQVMWTSQGGWVQVYSTESNSRTQNDGKRTRTRTAYFLPVPETSHGLRRRWIRAVHVLERNICKVGCAWARL